MGAFLTWFRSRRKPTAASGNRASDSAAVGSVRQLGKRGHLGMMGQTLTLAAATAQCLRNVSAILQAAGSSLEKAVSATFILADPEDFAGFKISIALIAEA